MSHFNQPNIERKNCEWTTKYKRLLEVCIVQQNVEMKSVFLQFPGLQNVHSLFSRAEYSFSDQKLTFVLFGGDDTPCFEMKTTLD